MTSPGRFPERTRLLQHTLASAIQQCNSVSEILVFDDEPECAAWPIVARFQQAAADVGVQLLYSALPAGPKGRVNMRLKRNVALLQCKGDVAVFCDDDDWRSVDSVQAQLDALEAHLADVCTIQVQHICELDPLNARPTVRYFDTPDGDDIFSQRLGNPGTAALRRAVWEANPSLGFPDTACEDVDFLRLLLADAPVLETMRPRKCSHILLDQVELRRQQRDRATFMTVRLVGYHHEWPLQPLDREPTAKPPPCLTEADVHFYEEHCIALMRGVEAKGDTTEFASAARKSLNHLVESAADTALTDTTTPLPLPPAGLAATLLEASRRMESANRALLLLSAFIQAHRSHSHQQTDDAAPLAAPVVTPPPPLPSDAIESDALVLAEAATIVVEQPDACRTCEHEYESLINALEALRKASAAHRAHAEQHAQSSDGVAVAERLIAAGAMWHVSCLLHHLVLSSPNDAVLSPPALRSVSCAVELAEECLFRSKGRVVPPSTVVNRQRESGNGLLEALGAVLMCQALASPGHAAAAGALQHLLTREDEQSRLAKMPLRACSSPLVLALSSADPSVRRRAAGAICNASANDGAMLTLINAGAAAALTLHLVSPSASLHVSLRALERLCTMSARAREQAMDALPEGGLLSCLAELLSKSAAGSGPHAQARALASRMVAALSRSESRHWAPVNERPDPHVWPVGSFVYYTGVALEPWGPEKLETGLGGSETAVLQLSRRWALAGHEVTVYLRMGSEACAGGNDSVTDGSMLPDRTWHGVRLRDVARFNPCDTFDTLVVWRSLEVLDEALRARLVLLDLHDMPRPHEMTERRLLRVDRIMVKSEFQKEALPLPAAARPLSVIPNGVDEELIKQVMAQVGRRACAARDSPQLVYTSSYDRGLEYMLRFGWPLLSEAVPGATLHLYYGWRTHELLYPISEWRDQMRELIAACAGRVIDHGRVGQPELLRAKAQAQILYYVGDWPEIDCIAVREAAMLGCVPLTSTVAVFGDEAKDYIVRVAGDPRTMETQRAAARRAADILLAYQRTGDLPSVDTATLRSETWAAIASRWLEVAEGGTTSNV